MKAREAGRREAEEKANKKIILRTPQTLLMGTPEGDAWLDAPEQIGARLANDVANYYFMLACILGGAKSSTKSDKKWAAKEVLQCARSWVLPLADTKANRLTVFLGSFVRAVQNYKSTRAIWTAPIDEQNLPKDPTEAERRREWLQHRRDHKLLPTLAPNLAKQAEQEFLRLYPEERGKIDVAKLAEAIAAFGLDDKRPGRKPRGQTGKYDTLAEAIRGASFASDGSGLGSALRRATERDEKRREQVRAAEKARLSESWEPPTIGGEDDDE